MMKANEANEYGQGLTALRSKLLSIKAEAGNFVFKARDSTLFQLMFKWTNSCFQKMTDE